MSTYYRSPRRFKQGFRPRRRPTLSPAEHAEIGETLDSIEKAKPHWPGSWPQRAGAKVLRHIGQLRLRMQLPSAPAPDVWERSATAEHLYDLFDQCVLDIMSGKVKCATLDCALRCERALFDLKIAIDDVTPLAVRYANTARPHGRGVGSSVAGNGVDLCGDVNQLVQLITADTVVAGKSA
jgi:hypothetical protein